MSSEFEDSVDVLHDWGRTKSALDERKAKIEREREHFQCSKCEKVFSCPCLQLRHRLVHLGFRPFNLERCIVCEKSPNQFKQALQQDPESTPVDTMTMKTGDESRQGNTASLSSHNDDSTTINDMPVIIDNGGDASNTHVHEPAAAVESYDRNVTSHHSTYINSTYVANNLASEIDACNAKELAITEASMLASDNMEASMLASDNTGDSMLASDNTKASMLASDNMEVASMLDSKNTESSMLASENLDTSVLDIVHGSPDHVVESDTKVARSGELENSSAPMNEVLEASEASDIEDDFVGDWAWD